MQPRRMTTTIMNIPIAQFARIVVANTVIPLSLVIVRIEKLVAGGVTVCF